jgi:3-oxoacyl-[acyl-carrier protein] reductase
LNLGLEGRRALVLGASRGLGAAVAASLLAEGATVIAAGRWLDAGNGWIEALSPAERARVHKASLDLTKRETVEALAVGVLADGAVDILVNNSGGPPPGAAATVEADAWAAQFEAMASNLFLLTRRLLPAMVAQRWGRVLSIASSGVEQPIPNLAMSNAIRASLVGWSKTLAGEVAASGVTVNVVVPGRIHTDRVDQLDGLAAERQGKSVADIAAASAASIPAGRYGTPREFADMVTFLASERASYVTGARIRVDGGMIRSI